MHVPLLRPLLQTTACQLLDCAGAPETIAAHSPAAARLPRVAVCLRSRAIATPGVGGPRLIGVGAEIERWRGPPVHADPVDVALRVDAMGIHF